MQKHEFLLILDRLLTEEEKEQLAGMEGPDYKDPESTEENHVVFTNETNYSTVDVQWHANTQEEALTKVVAILTDLVPIIVITEVGCYVKVLDDDHIYAVSSLQDILPKAYFTLMQLPEDQ